MTIEEKANTGGFVAFVYPNGNEPALDNEDQELIEKINKLLRDYNKNKKLKFVKISKFKTKTKKMISKIKEAWNE